MEWGTVAWFESQFRDAGSTGDAWGHRWRGSQKLRYRLALEILEPVLASGPLSVLDIGCALGDFTAELHRRNHPGSVLAVDVSRNAIGRARILHPHIRFQCAALPSLPFEDERFELLLALEVIYYLSAQDRSAGFQEAQRLISKGGYLLFSSVLDDGARYFTETELRTSLPPGFSIMRVEYNYARLYSAMEAPLLRLWRWAGRLRELMRLSDTDFEEWYRRCNSASSGRVRLMRIARSAPLGARLAGSLSSIVRWPIETWLGLEFPAAAAARLTERILGERGRTHIFVLAKKVSTGCT